MMWRIITARANYNWGWPIALNWHYSYARGSTVPKLCSSKADTVINNNMKVKSYNEIPGLEVSAMRNIVYILRNIKHLTGQFHKMGDDIYKQYGPVARSKQGGFEMIFVFDPNDIQRVFRADGEYPIRPETLPWTTYQKERQIPFGLINAENEEWKEIRSAVDKRMLRLKHVNSYASIMNHIIDDFISYLLRLRDKNDIKNEIDGFDAETFRWSLETVLCIILDKRLGCLDNPPKPRAEAYHEAVIKMMQKTIPLTMVPPYYKYIKTRHWKEYCKHWDVMFQTGLDIVRERKIELDSKAMNKMNIDFLTDVKQNSNLTEDRLNSTLVDLMLGASDTSANTITWTMILLSQYPEMQEKLHREVVDVLKDGKEANAETIQKTPYLRACVKESLRLYPVVFNLARVLGKDVVLGGYHVPAGSQIVIPLYHVFHNESLFPEPEVFKPERWITADGGTERAGFKYLPFGFGTRMCIGRRIAELEMHLLIAKLTQQFIIGCNNADEIQPIARTTLTPNKSVKITLTERRGL